MTEAYPGIVQKAIDSGKPSTYEEGLERASEWAKCEAILERARRHSRVRTLADWYFEMLADDLVIWGEGHSGSESSRYEYHTPKILVMG